MSGGGRRLSPTAKLRLALVAMLIVVAGIAVAAGVSGDGDGSASDREPNPGVSSVAGRAPTTAARMRMCLTKIDVGSRRVGRDLLRVTLPSGRRVDVAFAAAGGTAAGTPYVNNVFLSIPGTQLSQLDRHVLFNCAY